MYQKTARSHRRKSKTTMKEAGQQEERSLVPPIRRLWRQQLMLRERVYVYVCVCARYPRMTV